MTPCSEGNHIVGQVHQRAGVPAGGFGCSRSGGPSRGGLGCGSRRSWSRTGARGWGSSSATSPRPSVAICHSKAHGPSHCAELTQRRSMFLCCRHQCGRVGNGMADEALEEPAWQMVGDAYATRWRRLVLHCRIWGIICQRLQEVKKPLRDRLKTRWPAPSQRIYRGPCGGRGADGNQQQSLLSDATGPHHQPATAPEHHSGAKI